MNNKEHFLFETLKSEVAKVFLQDFPMLNSDYKKWKGMDITYFQESLRKKTKANVSEKWFYTYFKQDFEKLPRIDMLNLLSKYCGYDSWNDFVFKNESRLFKDLSENKASDESKLENSIDSKLEKTLFERNSVSAQGVIKWVSISVVALATFSIIFYLINYTPTYTFCFIDKDRKSPIKNPIEIIIERKGETPRKFMADKNGCFSYSTKDDTLYMTVNSTFHKETKLKFSLHNQSDTEIISLEPDDYALMLNYYLKTINNQNGTKELIQRRKQLDRLISDKALIYQVFDNQNYGVEVLSKDKYINLMTTPTSSLKNYQLIYSKTDDNGKIVKIKFKIEEDEELN